MDVFILVKLLSVLFVILGSVLIISCRKVNASQKRDITIVGSFFIVGAMSFFGSPKVFDSSSVDISNYFPLVVGILFITLGIIFLSRFLRKNLSVKKI